MTATRHLFYLRALAELCDGGGSPTTHEVAARLGVTFNAATTMMRKLLALGLVAQGAARKYRPTYDGLVALESFGGTVAGYKRLRRPGAKRRKPLKAPKRVGARAVQAAPRPAPAAPEPPAEASLGPVLRPGTLPRCGGWERRGPMRWRWVG